MNIKRGKRNNRHSISKTRSKQPDIVFGRFTAKGICLEEAAINNLILRISLPGIENNASNQYGRRTNVESKSYNSKRKSIGGKLLARRNGVKRIVSRVEKRYSRNRRKTTINTTKKGNLRRTRSTNKRKIKPKFNNLYVKELKNINNNSKYKCKTTREKTSTIKSEYNTIENKAENEGIIRACINVAQLKIPQICLFKIDSVLGTCPINQDVLDLITLGSAPKRQQLVPMESTKRNCGKKMFLKRYCLKFPMAADDGCMLTLQFHKLIDTVRNVKLPNRDWMVKFLLRQRTIMFVSFINNRRLERSVTFASANNMCNIVVDCCQVRLLGSPKTVNTIQDIEVLINIVHNISVNDCMILKVIKK